MDRSFLSQPSVIDASRNFVCIRLTTYEDEAEMKFCRSLFVGKSGDAENTTFTILSPAGTEALVRIHRSPKHVFDNATSMAEKMNQISDRYPKEKATAVFQSLPVTLDARLGLNVAASDELPLVVVLAADAQTRDALESKVGSVAWNSQIIGRFTFATAVTANDIPNVNGITLTNGIIVIQPDPFGQKGTMVQQIESTETPEGISKALLTAWNQHSKSHKSMREHRAEGTKSGAFWEPKLGVTDREEASARERTRKAIENQKKKLNPDHKETRLHPALRSPLLFTIVLLSVSLSKGGQ